MRKREKIMHDTEPEDIYLRQMSEGITKTDIQNMKLKYPEGSTVTIYKERYIPGSDSSYFEKRLALVLRKHTFTVSTSEGTFTWAQICQWDRQEKYEKTI